MTRLTRYLANVFTLGIPLLFAVSTFSCHQRYPINKKVIRNSEKLIDLSFTKKEIDTMMNFVNRNMISIQEVRKVDLETYEEPAFQFDPRPLNFSHPTTQYRIYWPTPKSELVPNPVSEVVFWPLWKQAYLLRTQQITSTKLTQLYLDRINKIDHQLKAVITVTDSLALQQAQQADLEIAAGNYRGLLHGIPYGVKDLVAVSGYPTTWGSRAYEDQHLDHNAHIIDVLTAAGGVLVAKLSSGSLARGDVWFGGKTKNPWDLKQGSSGSSAGSAAATSAGLVSYAIGTETWGSITSPSSRCGVTGLRPTYGRVSRDGIMPLAWTLDKVGPISRTALDCAIVFDIIRSVKENANGDIPFNFNPELNLRKISLGYIPAEITADSTSASTNLQKGLAVLRALGIRQDSVRLPDDLDYDRVMHLIIRAEAGAVFDNLIRSNRDDLLVEQHHFSRANSLRGSRFIPAVEYLQAMRHRQKLIELMNQLFQSVDVIFISSASKASAIGNLTGHPVISIPNGFDDNGRPTSFGLLGRLYDEATILAIGHAYQNQTTWDEQIPPNFAIE